MCVHLEASRDPIIQLVKSEIEDIKTIYLTFICSNRQVGCVWNIELMAPLWVRLTAIATVMTIGMAVSWWTCNPMIGLCRG